MFPSPSKYVISIILSSIVPESFNSAKFLSIITDSSIRRVLFFSLAFTIIELMFFNLINVTSAFLTAPASLLGIYLLDVFFWKRFVPNNLKFRKREIRGPLIIAILVSLFFAYLVFQSVDINNI